MQGDTIELLVCLTCRRGQEVAEGGTRPGAALHAALDGTLPPGVALRGVACLQNCDAGCTAALRGPGRWSYVYGNIHEVAHPDVLRAGAARYRDTTDGLIPWRQRPEHFKRNCVARLPPPDPDPEPEPAE